MQTIMYCLRRGGPFEDIIYCTPINPIRLDKLHSGEVTPLPLEAKEELYEYREIWHVPMYGKAKVQAQKLTGRRYRYLGDWQFEEITTEPSFKRCTKCWEQPPRFAHFTGEIREAKGCVRHEEYCGDCVAVERVDRDVLVRLK